MSTGPPIDLQLSDQERDMIELLQRELGLSSHAEVLRVLLHQAMKRRAVVCPTCGHMAQRSAADQASCSSCLSILQLSQGIWQAIQSDPRRPKPL
jgi:rubrerythrin